MRILTGSLALFALTAAMAHGQIGPQQPPRYGPGFRPNLNPALNLTRSQFGNNQAAGLAADYFLGTRVEQQRRANAAEFGTRIGDIETREQIVNTGTAPLRGGYFNNTMGFYNNTGGQQRQVQQQQQSQSPAPKSKGGKR